MSDTPRSWSARVGLWTTILTCTWLAGPAFGQNSPPQPEFPKFEDVTKDYEKVVSTADGKKSLYTIWVRKKDGQMLAEIPKSFASQKHFIALTLASGDRYAGLQSGDMYVYWRRYDKRMALIEPNLDTRSTGDEESKSSVKRLFTDRVILDVPILTMVPQGGPLIDMDELLVGQASTFFGSRVRGANKRLATVQKAKAFPENVELAFELPTREGRLQTLHYSISLIPENTSYKPRVADERIGFFTTAYSDLGKFKEDETKVRYINRWFLEKADKDLKISPPKAPIVFYIEHTTPVRYRRWVRQGVLYWNKAFEKIGLAGAIEVYYQDKSSGAHMEKDPEDVRYNFLRWLSNNQGTAIGPSRVNPVTGQILDADVILTDGWIRHYWQQFHEVFPQTAMEGFGAETLAWLATHPDWDPRIRLAPPAQREYLKAEISRTGARPFGGHPMTQVDPTLIGDDEYDGLIGRTSQVNGMCRCAAGKAFDVAIMRMQLALAAGEKNKGDKKKDDKKDDDKEKDDKKKGDKKDQDKKKDEEEKKEDDKDKESEIDGMPESFVGPLLAELVCHEVGHTLGLRHNFKGSSVYSLAEINSEKLKAQTPHAGSVMDYLPINMNMTGKVQGDYTMLGIGPYDHWAIEYGYTFDSDLKPILGRVAEPELAYATDEDTSGPDPLARRYDFAKDPLAYANNQIALAKHNRARLIDKFVKDGDNWSKAREGYETTLFLQTRAVSMMANWIGGAFIYRDKKGDKNARPPIEVVTAKAQRQALQFVIEQTFRDEAFGLSPELLVRLSSDRWLDRGSYSFLSEEAAWPVHDRIMGIQASTLTMLMNPTTLKRVYDNESRVPADKDALTLPELLDTLADAIWTELSEKPSGRYTARQPMISSLRRNLQREHLERLIDLSLPGGGSGAASKSIITLVRTQLASLAGKIKRLPLDKLDPYSRAHLGQAAQQIEKAIDAQYIYNADKMGGGGGGMIILRIGEGDEQR